MVVCCAGMYRSASTLTYNITKNIIERENLGNCLAYPNIRDIDSKNIIVCKCHDLDEKWDIAKEEYWKKFFCIYSYRDIRDVIASFCVWRNMTLDAFDFQGHSVHSLISWLLDLDEKWRSSPNLLLIKYSDYLPYQKREIVKLSRKIASFLNICPSEQTYIEIAKTFNINTVKDFCDNLEEGDKSTLLNPRHVSDGKRGKWKQFTEKEKHKYFYSNVRLMEWLRENNYE